jgi:hypothetical protein
VTNAPANRVCRYCGLESTVSHASVNECVVALQQEGNRLREHLRNGAATGNTGPQSSDDHVNARAIAPRLVPRVENEGLIPDWPIAARSR